MVVCLLKFRLTPNLSDFSLSTTHTTEHEAEVQLITDQPPLVGRKDFAHCSLEEKAEKLLRSGSMSEPCRDCHDVSWFLPRSHCAALLQRTF